MIVSEGAAETPLARPRLKPRSLLGKLLQEFRAVHLRLWLADALQAPMPVLVGPRGRALLYKLAGLRIGSGCRFLGRVTFDTSTNPYARLTVGDRVQFGIGCHVSLNAEVVIEDDVTFGHYVRVLTDNHEIGPSERRCGDNIVAPVRVERGAWVCTGAILLPGSTVGRGSIVAAGAVVHGEVPPDTLVGGVPARPIRSLPPEDAAGLRPLIFESRAV
jgi:maltose O-acetyltransferase